MGFRKAGSGFRRSGIIKDYRSVVGLFGFFGFVGFIG